MNDKSKWYGPEDPRILLVKNKLGYQEPLIIFNSNHRLIKNIVDEGEGISTFHYDHFRTMFLAWPWQYQYGKKNVDGMSNPKYDNNLYTKVVELRIKGEKRSLQKNWTPFVSVRDRESNGDFDKYLYFVFRWSSIKVLKCDLVTESISIGSADPLECSVDYEIDPDYVEGEDVGAMRGGTELISIDELLTSSNKEGEYNSQLDKIVKNLPAGREIWIGVARANIKNCGCGGIIYRPNLAVITREGGKFKVHLISSFFSLDVDVAGWYLDKPNEKCVAELPNIYIPNGIAGWYFEKDSESIEDYMTLSFSLGDYTCHIIHLKGLLTSLINLDSNVEDKIFSKSINSENLGHNDDNIYCALQRSEQFCFDYGKENGWVEPPNKEE